MGKAKLNLSVSGLCRTDLGVTVTFGHCPRFYCATQLNTMDVREIHSKQQTWNFCHNPGECVDVVFGMLSHEIPVST